MRKDLSFLFAVGLVIVILVAVYLRARPLATENAEKASLAITLPPQSQQLLSAPPEIYELGSGRVGANNCLFDAVIAAARIKPHLGPNGLQMPNSQRLRELCDERMRAAGELPTVNNGEMAGEGYLTTLSEILRATIHVIKRDHDTSTGVSIDVCVQHGSLTQEEAARMINIRHIGSHEHGHWEALL